jgi:hypothetical protein
MEYLLKSTGEFEFATEMLTWPTRSRAYAPSPDRERAVPAYLIHAATRSAATAISHYFQQKKNFVSEKAA